MKKILLIITALIIISAGSSQSVNIDTSDNSFKILKTNIIHVDDENTCGPWDGSCEFPYQTITDGINNAEEKDIIYVLEGIYNEQIKINKSIHIIGEEIKSTIIDAEYQEYAIKITKDNVKMEGLTIRNAGGYKGNSGIIIESNKNEISDCVIKRTRTGIFLNHSNENSFDNCSLYLNGEGIYYKSSENNIINNCEIAHSSIGLNIKNSNEITIKNSYIHECGTGIFTNNSNNIDFQKCSISDNNDNGGGCIAYRSTNFNFENCNILHNGFAILVKESENIYITKCDISNITHYGLWIQKGSKNIKINSCNIINNFRHAVSMGNGDLQITNSNIYNNQIGSINVRNSLCDARHNFWGGKLGPFFNNGYKIPNRLKLDYGKLKTIPWSLNPFKNAGSDWNEKDTFTKTQVNGYEDKPIEIGGNDTDNDGIPDWWEEKYNGSDPNVWEDHINIDNDGDGLNNFEECYAYEYGADPNKKDIFLEFDWTKSKAQGASNIIPNKYIEEMKKRFEEHDITLHVDIGNLDGGEEIPYIRDFDFAQLTDIYWDYFLHNDLENPRKNIFHYGLICDKGPASGFAFIGWGHLNGFCISADSLSGSTKIIPRGKLIATGSMHELGHTLGLIVDDYPAIDNHATVKPLNKEFWKYRNYKSCMSYRYTYFILDYSDGNNGREDFNDWGNLEFDFFKNTHFEWPKN